VHQSVGARPWHEPSPDAAHTEGIGARLARTLPQAGRPLIVYLSGELGAGKTTLARGFLRALGVEDPVRSPTYTLLELYELGALTVVHLDLYRLRAAGELEGLGLADLALPGHVWLIEWPERAQARLPAPDLSIRLSIAPDAHALTVAAGTPVAEMWVQQARELAPGS
jgi:tRNA threonylcarbamoyladenosine biosynthesis protein TsaE